MNKIKCIILFIIVTPFMPLMVVLSLLADWLIGEGRYDSTLLMIKDYWSLISKL